MPRRTDIRKILILGSGPIVIGQACEFDYSGTQACKALRAEGFEVVLVNSTPATIMTDPETADRTYVEPLTVESVSAIIRRERPDALLPTVGGQTALNLSMALAEAGVLEECGVEMIGAKREAIRVAEDRELFKRAMDEASLPMPRGGFAHSWAEAERIVEETGYPAIIRPSFTLGGTGGGTAYHPGEFEDIVRAGLAASPVSQVLIEESILGWKEFELEVMRDLADNVVIICSIENFDPMGVHTGDSITVAPAQTLSDVEYQRLRDMAIKIIRKVGVETGGSNIQFAVNPENGEIRIIEMNPRVSRSSALASKATGFPIAKIAAKLAVGYTLDEIPNDITLKTPAAFEPALDYVVVKIPRFAFEKFPGADPELTTTMKSVGEAMSLGRNFAEALNKAMRSMETRAGGVWTLADPPGSLEHVLAALRPELAGEDGVRTLRHRLGVRPVYKTVDTCAAEFAADTPYHYSSYDDETEVAPSDRPKALILGSGPNRIGQGIEFDYSCVHAVMALRSAGFETVMVNCNPETVSTDYDTADRLYFEPLTFEDVLEVVHAEDTSGRAAGGPGVVGVIVQLGGPTPPCPARRLAAAGAPGGGTSPG